MRKNLANAADFRQEPRPDAVVRLGRVVVLGVQHVLVMYTGCVAVPLVFGAAAKLPTGTIGLLINADLLVAGVITLVQSVGVGKILGVRLPVVAGATFTAATPMILIGDRYGLAAVYGSMIAAGVFGVLIAAPFARAIRFFPPLVSGVVITVVGLSLIGVAAGLIAGQNPAAHDYAAPPRLALACGIVLAIVMLRRLTSGFLAQIAVLFGLIGGAVVAVPMGLANFSAVSSADWFGISGPLHFGAPRFPVAAVISMCVVMLVIFTESTANIMAVGEMTGTPLGRGDLARGLAADGLSGVVGGLMNGFPDTVFAQNAGLVAITGVRSRYVTATAGVVLVIVGLIPKLGAVVASLPGPVIGAAGLVMFATVTAVGVATLRTVPFEGTENLLIIAMAIGVGMLPVLAPQIYHRFPDWVQIIAGSAITSATLVAFVLNLVFNHTPHNRLRTQAAAASATDPVPDTDPPGPETTSDHARSARRSG